ncbi:MAG TPA: membrane protein insertase YidC [Candidatus Krumholzibacterium sp.]|nr:membrane protein insertase YidC [Candidatus Krumholzibacterium sp.]
MDKRSITAIALTFVILLAWQFLYLKPRQEEAMRQRAIAQREQAAADSIAALENAAATGTSEYDAGTGNAETVEGQGVAGERLEEETAVTDGGFFDTSSGPATVGFSVVNEKMRIGFTSRGGEISSVKLLGFLRKSGEEVELIPAGSGGGISLMTQIEGEPRSLSDLAFEATVNGRPVDNGEEIRLSEELETASVVFSRRGPGGEKIEKSFTLTRDGYEAALRVSIERNGELRHSAAWGVAWECGIALNEKNEKLEKGQLASLGKVGDEFYKEGPGKFKKESRKEQPGTLVWAGARSKYFLSAVIPEGQRSGTLAMLGDNDRGMVGYALEYPFRGDPRMVDEAFTCYFGPLDMETLKGYGVGLERTIDLGKLRFFSVFVLRLMLWMKKFIPNYGLIIIILSILTKVLFYRLTHKSFKSMKDMQKLQPRLKELQAKYKDDKEKLNKATMEMYKEAGVNPLGGCLPLLFQMPVFIALFNVLRNTIELRDAPFALWINDLSTPDVLFDFGVNLPILGSEFHLLPILMGVAMVVQSKMGASPTGDAGPASQTKMMQTMMPIVFTFVFYGMPSGLVLYWLINNILSIVQQYFVHRAVEAEEETGPQAA